MKIQPQCRRCGKIETHELSPAQVLRWELGEHIQDVMSELNANQRELLISGICGECYDKLFKEEE